MCIWTHKQYLTFVAAPLGLLEEDPHGSSLNIMLQGLTRFLCEKIVHDFKSMAPASPAMEQVRQPLELCVCQDAKHFVIGSCNGGHKFYQVHELQKRVYQARVDFCQRPTLSIYSTSPSCVLPIVRLELMRLLESPRAKCENASHHVLASAQK